MRTSRDDKSVVPFVGKVTNTPRERNRRYPYSQELAVFGKKILEARKIAGFSQEELAMVTDLSGSSIISQIERGKVGPKLRNIYRIAEALGIPPEILINGKVYTRQEIRKHMKLYEIMHNPNHPLRGALDTLLNLIE